MSGIVGAVLAPLSSDVTERMKGGASAAPTDLTARWEPYSRRFDPIEHGHFDLDNWPRFLYHYCANEQENPDNRTYWTPSFAFRLFSLPPVSPMSEFLLIVA